MRIFLEWRWGVCLEVSIQYRISNSTLGLKLQSIFTETLSYTELTDFVIKGDKISRLS
jgi:hypothetical protein